MISGKRYPDQLYLFSDGQNPTLRSTTPQFMQGEYGLLAKRKLAVKTATINTKNIPRFVPDLLDPRFNNYKANTGNDILDTTTGIIQYPTQYWYTQTNYSITLRKKPSSTASTSYNGVIGFVSFEGQTDKPYDFLPPDYNSFVQSRYTNKFFQLMNFTSFLSMVADTIDSIITLINMTTAQPIAKTEFYYDVASKNYELLIDKVILDEFYVEFNDPLNDLFIFPTRKILQNTYSLISQSGSVYYMPTNRLSFPPTEYTQSGNTYLKAISEYSNDIFPFQNIVIYSPDYPLQIKNIRTSQDQANQVSAQVKSFLTLNKNDLNSIKLEKNYTYTAKELAFNLHTIEGAYDNPIIDIRLGVITKENPNKITDWIFEPGQCVSMEIDGFDVY